MIKKYLSFTVLCLLFSGAIAQELQQDKWIARSNNKADGAVVISDNKIEMIRGSQGAKKYTLRAYQDVTVEPGGIYQFSYKIMVEGSGRGGGLIYLGNRQGKWDGKNIKYTLRKKECDFCEVKIKVTAGDDTVKFRVDLRAMGINTKVTYKDIKLERVDTNKATVLTPNRAAVEIDGKQNDTLCKNAPKLSPFQVLGNVSRNSSINNEVMLTIKAGYLYIAYRTEEPNIKEMKFPTAANVKVMQDTTSIYADECVETFISNEQKILYSSTG
jgi:hypothetical protein